MKYKSKITDIKIYSHTTLKKYKKFSQIKEIYDDTEWINSSQVRE